MSNEEAEARHFMVHVSGVADAAIRVTVTSEDFEPGEEITLEDWKGVAVEKALEIGVPRLCHQCSHHMNDVEEWRVGDWELGPENLADNVEEL